MLFTSNTLRPVHGFAHVSKHAGMPLQLVYECELLPISIQSSHSTWFVWDVESHEILKARNRHSARVCTFCASWHVAQPVLDPASRRGYMVWSFAALHFSPGHNLTQLSFVCFWSRHVHVCLQRTVRIRVKLKTVWIRNLGSLTTFEAQHLTTVLRFILTRNFELPLTPMQCKASW